MFYDFQVEIYNRLPSTKVNGVTIPGALVLIKTIDVDMQPYSTELLIKQYGYNIECNKRIFMDFDPAIKVGTILQYTNPQNTVEKYEVKKIINWDYLELACLGVV